jgi:tetratricopeptide (TPR) repeat protein
MASKEYAKAEEYCRAVKNIDNLNYYGNLYLVYAQMAQQKYQKAEIICRKMLFAYPCNITFLYLLKLNYTYQNQTKNAEQVQKDIDLLK